MSHVVSQNQIDAGQAVYSNRTLKVYDWWVLGFSNRWLWRCPTKTLLALYGEHLSQNHLEVGVGTGWFLDHCTPPSDFQLTLLDLNRACLDYTARRVARYRPQAIQGSVFEPIDAPMAPFSSIGVNYLFHCLPGNFDTTCVVFDHLHARLRPGGVLFGSTILGEGIRLNPLARRVMSVYNQKGIFSNRQDRYADLARVLDERFSQSTIRLVGAVGVFVAVK